MLARTGTFLSTLPLLGAAVLGCGSRSSGSAGTTTTTAATLETAARDSTSSSTKTEGAEGPCRDLAPLTNFSLSPDGTRMLTSCWGNDCKDDPPATSVDVWDIEKGALLRVLVAQSPDVRAVWASADLLFAQSGKGTGIKQIDIWDAHTFESLHTGSYYAAGPQIDPSGRRVLIHGIDGDMTLFDAASKKAVRRPEDEAHLGGDSDGYARFSTDGKRVFEEDAMAGIQVLDGVTLKRRARFVTTGATSDERARTALSPSMKRFAVAAPNGSLFFLDDKLSPGPKLAPKGTFVDPEDVQFLDEDRLLVGTRDGKLTVFDVRAKKAARVYDPPPEKERRCRAALELSPTGTYAAFTHGDCAIEILDGETLTPLWTLRAELVPPLKEVMAPSLVWARKDQIFAAIQGERLVVFHDAATGAERARVRLPDGVSQMSSDGLSYYPLQVGWTLDERHLVVAQGNVYFVRPEDGATAALSVMTAEGARVSVVTTDTEIEGPIAMDACLPRPVRPGAPAGPRAVGRGLLGAFLGARSPSPAR
ncbi:MAG: hypothetical protein U0441_10905 [Polyangiaceae bacterium]